MTGMRCPFPAVTVSRIVPTCVARSMVQWPATIRATIHSAPTVQTRVSQFSEPHAFVVPEANAAIEIAGPAVTGMAIRHEGNHRLSAGRNTAPSSEACHTAARKLADLLRKSVAAAMAAMSSRVDLAITNCAVCMNSPVMLLSLHSGFLNQVG